MYVGTDTYFMSSSRVDEIDKLYVCGDIFSLFLNISWNLQCYSNKHTNKYTINHKILS